MWCMTIILGVGLGQSVYNYKKDPNPTKKLPIGLIAGLSVGILLFGGMGTFMAYNSFTAGERQLWRNIGGY